MKPVVKWVGGKRQIIQKLLALAPSDFNKYYEPFVGGGAMLLNLKPKSFVINDINSELIDMYNCLSNKNKLQKLLNLCDEHQKNHSEQYFYQIRELDRKPNYQNLSEPEKVARLIYLNKTGFNGLYRVNLQGFFNVPYGKREKFSLYEKDNVEQILDYFKKSNFQIKNTDYKNAIKGAESGDFVYFDPPYDVITKTTFKSYSKYDFAQEQQIELANTFKTLSKKVLNVCYLITIHLWLENYIKILIFM
ncbi:DNA adenine methylase [Mycoplasma nasistruthionis]|uniref:Site-specific DNA-methyltransferase (adenine-specific) n=1 Tax=Mycoplasma nasistruthionis TaxID=353852 RepID=A0A5B7XWE5_9MOLU|nr:Dam family site-specific DNA-(adenine-N6)-methyltransferase [Mycoplasma nasistruthionis]QCZ36910.1 Dam family site-specific DNA-(adenine-N6)-methyltransferase [Mycoplasma nasistruthionis]